MPPTTREPRTRRGESGPYRGAHPPGLEQEADRVAGQVWAARPTGTTPRIQGYTNAAREGRPQVPASVTSVLAEPGAALEPALRDEVEQRFGQDFSAVRVHAGPAAERSARDVNAHAYTVGAHIVFGLGSYDPGTDRGKRVLAHELTHVLQQGGGCTDAAAVDRLQPFGIGDVVEAAVGPARVDAAAVDRRQPFGIGDVLEVSLGPVGEKLVHGHIQFLKDALASIKESPRHVVEFFADEVWESIKAHWLRILAVTAGLIIAEEAVVALTAAPEPVITKVIAAILQIVIIAVLGHYTAVEVKGAYEAGAQWLSAARNAKGDPKAISEASRSFVRMVWHIVMAVLVLAGVRARIRGATLPRGAAAVEGGGESGGAGAAGDTASAQGSNVTPISSATRFRSSTDPSPPAGGPAPTSAFGPRGEALNLAPAQQPLPDPVAPPEPVAPPAAASASPAAAAAKGPGVQPVPAVAAGLSSAGSPQKKKRPPFVLRLPQEKAPHLGKFRNWIGPDVSRHLRSDPKYLRGNPAQRGKWHQAHRIGGSDAIPAEVYERGHRLGLVGRRGERRIRVPDWSRTRPDVAMEVDHIIELQVTPPAFRDYFNSMENYELLDRGANGSAGPRLRANIAAERAMQVAFDPTVAAKVLPFDRVEMDGGGPGERWTSDDVRSGEQLDAFRR